MGIAGIVAHIIRVLGYRLHHIPQGGRQSRQQRIGRGACGCAGVAQQRFPHIAFFPTTTIAIIRIHIEIAIVVLITVILAIAKGNRCGADFANLEVNFVIPFLAAVVVEAQNEGVDGQIGESEVPNLAVDLNGLHITNRPIAGTLTGITDLFNGGPIVIIQGIRGKRDINGTGFISRGSIVGICGHADGNCGVSFCLAGNSYHIPGNTHRSHAGGAGHGADYAGAGAGHGDCVRHFRNIQGNGRFVQRKASCGLSNRPSNGFFRTSPIRPLVIRTGGESGVIASSVGAAGSAADGHFRTVITGPSRALSGTGISISRVVQNPEQYQKTDPNIEAIMNSCEVTEAQAETIWGILQECGVGSIEIISRDIMLDGLYNTDDIGYRIRTEDGNNPVLYLNGAGEVSQIRWANQTLYPKS